MDHVEGFDSIWFRPGSDLMFTKVFGWVMYSFISLSKSMPPARKRPSLPASSRALAGEVAVTYWNAFISDFLLRLVSRRFCLAQHLEDPGGGDGESADPDTESIGHRVCNRSGGRDRDWFANANNATLGHVEQND